MKRPPGYYWYPGDYKRDPGVMACAYQTRAIWRDMLDLMHEGEPYGHLSMSGVAITDPSVLARLIGATTRQVKAALSELELHRVFSRTSTGTIFCRRMVRDEEVRQARAKGGKSGGNPALKGSATEPPKDNLPEAAKDNLFPTSYMRAPASVSDADAVSSLSLVSSSSPSGPPPEVIVEFVGAANQGLAEHVNPALRQLVPRLHAGQATALEATKTLLATGIPREELVQMIREVARTCQHDGSVNSLGFLTERVRKKWRQDNAPKQPKAQRKTNSQTAASVAKLGLA